MDTTKASDNKIQNSNPQFGIYANGPGFIASGINNNSVLFPNQKVGITLTPYGNMSLQLYSFCYEIQYTVHSFF